MRSGIHSGGEETPPLSKRPNGKTGALSITNYKKALRSILRHKGKIGSKNDWIKAISNHGVYQHNVVLTRFLLFCASDDAVVDSDEKGLIKRGRRGRRPMLTLDRWYDEGYFTVEHIAPQSGANLGWESDIYTEPKLVHLLGNLTLLPKEENSVIGSRSWGHKRLMYSLLSSDTPGEFDAIKSKLSAAGLTLSKSADEVLTKSSYLEICKSIIAYDQAWNLGIISKRTERFADLAWERLEPWLFS